MKQVQNGGERQELSVDSRRKKILEILNAEGKVRVVELSKYFGMTEASIRNDLSELEKEGLLERVHGGAVSTYRSYFNKTFYERISTYEAEKRRIAAAVAGLIHNNDTLMINSGTTTFFIAQALKALKTLTVVTNSIAVAQELSCLPNFNVILLGGNYNPQYQFTYGDDAIAQLKKYRTDKLILSADGISVEAGITTHHHQEAEISKTMMERTKNTIVVADFSKIGRENFSYIAPIDAADILVTNENCNRQELADMKERGLEVITV